jgi:putative salt-induced outer membrane protein
MSSFVLNSSRAALSLVWLAAAAAQAADPVPADNRWHGYIALGGAFASGNASTVTLSATADTTKASPIDKINLSGLVNYGRAEDSNGLSTTTANQAWLRGRYDYNLTPTVFAFGGADAETNKVAGLNSRYDLNGGLGYKLIRTDVHSLDVFAGVGYATVDYVDNRSASGFELLFGEESNHKLSDTTTFKQRFVFRPGQNELGNLATFVAGLATSITGSWTLNVGLNVQYASAVPPGVKTTDTLLTVGFGYKY